MDGVIQQIITLLNANLTGYTGIYYGENFVPEQAIYPFVEVIPVGTSVENIWTGGLINNTFSVRIQIKDSLKKTLNANTDRTTVQYLQNLVKRFEERDGNGDLLSTTVLGVLTNNLQLTDTVNIVGDWDVSYNNIVPLNGSYQITGSVDFTVKNINPC